MSWVPSKEELECLIIPQDERYLPWPSSSKLGREWKREVVNDMLVLLDKKILKVIPRRMPASLPSKLPVAILETISQEVRAQRSSDWWLDYLNHKVNWCHHDPELGYLFARLLCHKYESRLAKGWRVEPDAWYSGYRSDLALINPKGECVIAVEIEDINPMKLVEPFRDRNFRQLWHRRYYSSLDEPQFDWQKSKAYFIWSRGINGAFLSKVGILPLPGSGLLHHYVNLKQ